LNRTSVQEEKWRFDLGRQEEKLEGRILSEDTKGKGLRSKESHAMSS